MLNIFLNGGVYGKIQRKYMKNFLSLFVVIGVAAVGVYFYLQNAKTSPSSENDAGEENSTNTETDITENEEDAGETGEMPAGDADSDMVKEFSIIAKQFSFEPATITVKKGDMVRLKVISQDVKHGLAIPEFGINAVLNPNEEMTIDFAASKSGVFNMFCSVLCGEGHADMKGTLIVEE